MLTRSFVILLTALSLAAQTAAGYPASREAALGKQLAAEFLRTNTPVESSVAQAYIDHLGDRLASHMPDVRLPFTFQLVEGKDCKTAPEPAALPGAHVFVAANLLLASQDEAEFAGALAHAMEHVAQRHGAYDASRGQSLTNGVIPLIFIAGYSGDCSASPALPLAFIKDQRRNDLEADRLAAEALAHAGVDPTGLLHYVQRLPAQDRDERVTNLRAALDTLPRSDVNASSSDEFIAAQKEVRRLTEPPVRPKARAVPTLKR